MTEYINNRPVKFCEHEHKITPRLYFCASKSSCEYKRTYPHFHICKKRESFRQSKDIFERNKEDILSRLNGGEEYHENSGGSGI
jgi:hypothetical protein